MYLCCLTSDRPRHWLRWLPWAEFCYNSSYQALLRVSLFCVVYNHDPPSVCSYTSSDAKLPVVHHQLLERDEFLSEICDRLEHAQQRYKYFYDEHH
jgi:hypothetical protein